MTTPGGMGSETEQSRDDVNVPSDADEGLPAATGPIGGGRTESGQIQAGGPATEATKDQKPRGVGSARSVEGVEQNEQP